MAVSPSGKPSARRQNPVFLFWTYALLEGLAMLNNNHAKHPRQFNCRLSRRDPKSPEREELVVRKLNDYFKEDE